MEIEQCKHTVTNGLICADCGIKVLEVETRPCKDCAHHKRLSDGSICKKHLMAIVPDMLVTFNVDKGTCFEVVAPSEEVKLKTYTRDEVEKLLIDQARYTAYSLSYSSAAFVYPRDWEKIYEWQMGMGIIKF